MSDDLNKLRELRGTIRMYLEDTGTFITAQEDLSLEQVLLAKAATFLDRLQAAEERAETLAAVAERAREELRLIRAKDSDAVYDTTLRLDMALALKTGA